MMNLSNAHLNATRFSGIFTMHLGNRNKEYPELNASIESNATLRDANGCTASDNPAVTDVFMKAIAKEEREHGHSNATMIHIPQSLGSRLENYYLLTDYKSKVEGPAGTVKDATYFKQAVADGKTITEALQATLDRMVPTWYSPYPEPRTHSLGGPDGYFYERKHRFGIGDPWVYHSADYAFRND